MKYNVIRRKEASSRLVWKYAFCDEKGGDDFLIEAHIKQKRFCAVFGEIGEDPFRLLRRYGNQVQTFVRRGKGNLVVFDLSPRARFAQGDFFLWFFGRKVEYDRVLTNSSIDNERQKKTGKG